MKINRIFWWCYLMLFGKLESRKLPDGTTVLLAVRNDRSLVLSIGREDWGF